MSEGIKALGLCFSQNLDRNVGVFMHPVLTAPIRDEYFEIHLCICHFKFSLYDIRQHIRTHLADLQTQQSLHPLLYKHHGGSSCCHQFPRQYGNRACCNGELHVYMFKKNLFVNSALTDINR